MFIDIKYFFFLIGVMNNTIVHKINKNGLPLCCDEDNIIITPIFSKMMSTALINTSYADEFQNISFDFFPIYIFMQ